MRKAMREAKVVTSWLNPSEAHEDAMSSFVRAILARDNTAFRQDFFEFHARVAQYGLYNSLSQLAVKIGGPGIPDFYQGTEVWDFSLVDPDNRRPVDYARRRALLDEVRAATESREARRALLERLMALPRDDRLKLYATITLLQFRKRHERLMEEGAYEPLLAEGARRDHVFGFARMLDDRMVLVVVPRLVAGLQPDADVPPLGARVWDDTRLLLPAGAPCCFTQVLTGERISTTGEQHSMRLADILETFPIAFLESSSA